MMVSFGVHAQQLNMLSDINPNGSSSPLLMNPNPSNNYALFAANDGVSGVELYKTDGTASGTQLVKDITVGSGNSLITFLGSGNGSTYFQVRSGGNYHLYVTDGTTNGTVHLFGFNVGDKPGVFYKNRFYYACNSPTAGNEFCSSAGTPSSTGLVEDYIPGSGSLAPFFLVKYQGFIYFRGNHATNGNELFRTDGSSTGSTLVADINVGSGDSKPGPFISVGGWLYFSANDGAHGFELWRTNGTNTHMVKDINPGNTSGLSLAHELFEYKDKVYFRADDGSNGLEYWQSDGTMAGTIMLKDINPNGNGVLNPRSVLHNNELYFAADNGVDGKELWKTNGTPSGTIMVDNLNPNGGTASIPSICASVAGKLLFVHDDGASTGGGGTHLFELETDASTIEKIYPTGATELNPVNTFLPLYYSVLNDKFLFGANYDAKGSELYMYDPANTTSSFKLNAFDLDIFPNPSLDYFDIVLPPSIGQTQLRIFDGEGKLVLTENLKSPKNRIDVKHLPAGPYSVSVENGNEVGTKMLMKY